MINRRIDRIFLIYTVITKKGELTTRYYDLIGYDTITYNNVQKVKKLHGKVFNVSNMSIKEKQLSLWLQKRLELEQLLLMDEPYQLNGKVEVVITGVLEK